MKLKILLIILFYLQKIKAKINNINAPKKPNNFNSLNINNNFNVNQNNNININVIGFYPNKINNKNLVY